MLRPFLSMRRAVAKASLRTLLWSWKRHGPLAISVVLIARGRASYLRLALAALERQSLPTGSWEILLFALPWHEADSSVWQEYTQRGKLRLVQYHADTASAYSFLLNEAIAQARGKILVFLSEDRLVQPDFLLQHLLLHLKELCVVLGDDHRCIHTHLFAHDEPEMNGVPPNPCLTPQDLDNPSLLTSLTFPGESDYTSLFAYAEQQHKPLPHPWALFSTANASVPREAVEQAGGFDPYFSGWGLEDTDLAYRLHQAGLPFRYAPKAPTLRQLHPARRGNPRDLHWDFTHFFAKHPRLSTLERRLVTQGHVAAP